METEGLIPHSQEPTLSQFWARSNDTTSSALYTKIHCNISCASTPGSFKWTFTFRFSLYAPLLSSIPVTWPAHLILFYLITLIIFDEEYRLFISSLCCFLRSPVSSSPLGQNIFLSNLFSDTLSLRSSINLCDQVAHPYKITGTIISLCILIFTFLDSRLEDKKFCTEWY
jgi:hypothetical protein